MRIRKLTFLISAFCWCLTNSSISADDRFAELSSISEVPLRIEVINVKFDVYEVINSELVELKHRFDDDFTSHIGGSWFMQDRSFFTLYTDRPFAVLFSSLPPPSDVVDSRPFNHCPVLPDKMNLAEMDIKTKEDFIQSLGMPVYQIDGYSFIGLFDIRSKGTRFCWILLEHSSKRLFVGFSERIPVSFRKLKNGKKKVRDS